MRSHWRFKETPSLTQLMIILTAHQGHNFAVLVNNLTGKSRPMFLHGVHRLDAIGGEAIAENGTSFKCIFRDYPTGPEILVYVRCK